MKILLINPPKEKEFTLSVLDDYNTKARSNQPPLGLLYLYSYIKDSHDVHVLDMNAKEMIIEDIIKKLHTFQPDVIGITCVISKWLTVRDLAQYIKKCKDIPIVLGGVNPSLYPYETLQCKDIDYVISGFGQIPFKTLCDQLETNSYTDNISNCYSKNNCNSTTKGHFEFVDIDEFPLPDRSILSVEDYSFPFFPENPSTSMLTSLGCPHACGFCACKNFQPVKIRKVANIIKELQQVENLGIRSVLFQDELFTMSTKRINEICSSIIENNIKLNWAVRSRANLINIESLLMMKKAGCFNVHLGIESGTDRILTKMKKNLTVDIIKKSVSMIKQAGLSCSASFMLGYPTETKEEILETIDFAVELGLNNCQFFTTIPEPDTELYIEVQQIKKYTGNLYSKFTIDPTQVNLHDSIASDIFTKEEMNKFLELAYSKTNNLYNMRITN